MGETVKFVDLDIHEQGIFVRVQIKCLLFSDPLVSSAFGALLPAKLGLLRLILAHANKHRVRLLKNEMDFLILDST